MATIPAQTIQLAVPYLSQRDSTNGDRKALIQQHKSGIPCPVGWLHYGRVSSPTGGSNWSLVVGWDQNTQQFLMNDPYGEADLVAGGFNCTSISSGKGMRYFLKNWGAR